MLTHAAIAAREYNIPAVVGTWNATASVRDGDIVRIDGTAGAVEILSRA
jgi:pyruvate,water dikinase